MATNDMMASAAAAGGGVVRRRNVTISAIGWQTGSMALWPSRYITATGNGWLGSANGVIQWRNGVASNRNDASMQRRKCLAKYLLPFIVALAGVKANWRNLLNAILADGDN